MYDIVIIGGGPAGMTAAIYGARAGKKVLVIEANTYGGQIVYAKEVENYPGLGNVSGYELASKFYKQTKGFDVDFKFAKVLEIKDDRTIVTDKGNFTCKTVIIATGVKKRSLNKLNIQGEENLNGHGISYCATCDGNFFKGLDVAVYGGGNTALDDALYLSNLCNKVYLIHRREELRGEEILIDELEKKDNVQFALNNVISKIYGDNLLTGIDVQDNATKEIKHLDIKGLFVAIGVEADNTGYKNVVDLDATGYIIAGEDCKTRTPWVFVAGDCRTKAIRQLTTAASDGTCAALAAVSFIGKEGK